MEIWVGDFLHIDQGLGQIRAFSCFVSKILLEYSYPHLLTCYLWLLCSINAELSGFNKLLCSQS